MVSLPKKKRLKGRRISLKRRIVAVVVIVVPILFIIAWIFMTVFYHEPLATK